MAAMWQLTSYPLRDRHLNRRGAEYIESGKDLKLMTSTLLV